MGPKGCPKTSVKNYHYSLRNDPEERSSHLVRGGSHKYTIKLTVGGGSHKFAIKLTVGFSDIYCELKIFFLCNKFII